MTERIAGRKAAARRTARRRRMFAGGAAALTLCLAGGGVALAAGRGPEPTYRTAAAATGSVEQTLDLTGAVASAGRYDVAFPVAGTVAEVAVAVGDAIAGGDVLATLDTTELQAAVDDAQTALTAAKDVLAADLESQTATASTTTSTASTASTATTATVTPSTSTQQASTQQASTQLASTAGSGSTAPGSTGTTGADPALAGVASAVAAVEAAQRELLAQYELVAAALAASSDAVAASQETCAVFSADDDATPEPEAATGAATDPPADDEPAAAAEPTLADCQAAIAGVLADQTGVDDAQRTLSSMATALDTTVTAARTAITTAQTAAVAAAAAVASAATAPATATTPAATPTSAGAAVASAATILADRAAITLAEAEVALAQHDLDRSNLTSPVAGTVGAIAIVAGDSVSASSTTAVITVLANDGFVVTTTVPLASVDTVAVGQVAEVTVASTTETLAGAVSSIGVLNASTDSSDPTYSVVIALDATDALLFNGASAEVTVLVGEQDDTLTVPSSAVHVAGSTSTVQVLAADGTVSDVVVTTGAKGTELTEITSGVALGDQIVLADLSEVLGGSDADADTSLTGLGDSTDTGQQFGPPVGMQLPAGGPPGS